MGSLNKDALKPTNPVTHKAMVESSVNQNQISPKKLNGLKIKPVTSTLSTNSLFAGLEKFDGSIQESFSCKPNAKRIITKLKVSTSTTLTSNTNSTSSMSVVKSQETIPTDTEEDCSSQLPTTSLKIDNARLVSYIYSNLVKVAQQNLNDHEVNTTIQELFSSGKSTSNNVDKHSTGHFTSKF